MANRSYLSLVDKASLRRSKTRVLAMDARRAPAVASLVPIQRRDVANGDIADCIDRLNNNEVPASSLGSL